MFCDRLRRRGFTVLELQFSVMVMALLAALLLPAVQQTREAARKSQCQDHLHNLLIAVHNYESAYKVFPPGWVHQEPQRSNYGWQTSLLPFVEQMPLYNRLDMGRPALAVALPDPKKAAAFRTVVDVYRCPSDISPPSNPDRRPLDKNNAAHDVSTSNYVGSNGGGEWTSGKELRGVFGENSNTRFRDITDGTSNVLFVGERSRTLTRPDQKPVTCAAAIWLGVSGDGEDVSEDFTLCNGQFTINARELIPETDVAQCIVSQSSLHAGGSQVALGDGKVSFLSENIDHQLLKNLMDKADGKPARVP